ncbi:hypothetical protein K491DRAFT_412366 [Lophiostoma macrostomum CBS 122681]|uniref:Uncharacterized protein n=1 Tax=Lophiostoma macrostomum CBS 122681 TaxID=1314788 RepID=A0A6A6T7C1_9PLEO|nr:hypothetical protein K491DRAFT_412366 [Lophiostoma macrostomum CBS 122681]
MRFAQAITSLLMGAALTTSITAAPLSRRLFGLFDDDLVDDIDHDDDDWEQYASFCSNPSAAKMMKREASACSAIEARADRPTGFSEVAVNNADGFAFPIGLWSQSFVSCVGVVIVGTKDDGTKAQALAHFLASKETLNDTWKKFKDLVKGFDLDDSKAYLSIPNYDGDDDEKPSGWTSDDDNFGRDFVATLLNFIDDIADDVETVHARAFNTQSTMDVSPDHVVRVNDAVIS